MIDALKIGLKREYWEYKRVMLGLPLLLSILIFLAALMATIYAENIHEWADEQRGQEQSVENQSEAKSPRANQSVATPKADDEPEIQIEVRESPVEFVAIFLSLGWFVGMYYLLSALYMDRRDNSVLYWKSLPVSETRNVLTKLLFGSVCFVLVTLLAAWFMYLLLHVFDLGNVDFEQGGLVTEREFEAAKLFLWPLHGIVAGLLWGAPIFAYLLMISSLAKRSRLLLLLAPMVVIAVLEGIFLRSNVILTFAFSHLPHAVLEQLGATDSLTRFWQGFFGAQLPSLVLGLVLSVVFLCVAVWRRNDHFET